jgi:hypothetical protein
MTALPTLSARPQFVVDASGGSVGDLTAQLGGPGPFGRNRLVPALPLNKSHAVQLAPAWLLVDSAGCLLADPSGANLLGAAALYVHRLLAAAKTSNTRRL